MDRLPQELLGFIIDEVAHWDDYASRADLKNLRLSCRTLASSAAPHLFHTIPLWLSMSSLLNMVEASEHPDISPLVKGVAFSPMTLGCFFELERRIIRDETKQSFEREFTTMNQYEMFSKRYLNGWKTYALERQQLFNHPTRPRVETILLRVFRKLSNLQCIEVDTEGNVLGVQEVRRVMGRLTGEELSKNSATSLIHLFKALVGAEKRLTKVRIGVTPSRSKARSDVRRTTELQQCYGYLRPTSFDFFPESQYFHPDALSYAMKNAGPVHEVFKPLKNLEIDGIKFNPKDRGDPMTRLAAGLRPLVIAAEGLEKLRITNLYHGWGWFDDDLDFEGALPIQFRCHQLKVLICDDSCLGDTRLLTGLVEASSETLEYVRLFEFTLANFGWQWTMDCMRKKRYPSLRKFEIENPRKTRGHDIAPYVKRLTDVPPLQHDEEILPAKADENFFGSSASTHIDDTELLALAGLSESE